MKLIIITFLLFSIIFINCKSGNKKNQITKNTQSPLIKNTDMDSVAYGYASNDNNILANMAELKTAEIMPKIPIHLNHPYTGVIAEASTFVTDKFYYNGSDNLNAIHVHCNVYTGTPHGCVHNSKCGWCEGSSSCVEGNSSGPLAPCLRNTFLYMAPTPEWNPLKAGTHNILALDSKGNPQNHLTWEPKDLGKTPVYSPYI